MYNKRFCTISKVGCCSNFNSQSYKVTQFFKFGTFLGQMAIRCNNINELIMLLRENGDKILDASSKLSLSATLLYNLNESLTRILKQKQIFTSNFHVVDTNHCDLEFLYDFIQKTLALKVLPDTSFWNNEQLLHINIFSNLKLLEVQRLSLNLIKGIKTLRAQLEYLTCIHSLRNLREVLESCGADNSQGFVWRHLKEAVFSYNSLDSLDNSLEFAPWLHTLDLSHNRIQNAQLLHCLPNLKYLNISYNQLETVPSFAGQLCSQLRVLILSNNFIENLKELVVLVNLCELDLSNNCLLEHSCLIPVTNLAMLRYLNLSGNPLSYHPRHRAKTVCYLHSNIITSDFVLEMAVLNKAEKQLVGSISNLAASSRSHLDSVCSTESECTIVAAKHKNASVGDTGVSSDMDTSTSSVATVQSATDNEIKEINNDSGWLQNTLMHESMGMQDSGIVTGRRPTSPSESSIGWR